MGVTQVPDQLPLHLFKVVCVQLTRELIEGKLGTAKVDVVVEGRVFNYVGVNEELTHYQDSTV